MQRPKLKLLINGYLPTFQGKLLEEYLEFAQKPHHERIEWAKDWGGDPKDLEKYLKYVEKNCETFALQQIAEYRSQEPIMCGLTPYKLGEKGPVGVKRSNVRLLRRDLLKNYRKYKRKAWFQTILDWCFNAKA